MEIKQRIAFRNDEYIDLIKYLKTNKVKFFEDDQTSLIILEIFKTSPFWPTIKDYVIQHNMNPVADAIYSKKELQTAEWLIVRSQWRWQYPQPSWNGEYQNITYWC